MEQLTFVYNLLTAMLLGGLIGLERQFNGHAAGIRTCALVCMGASMFTAFPFCISGGDVTRMAAQIISGVGFLGSGIIFKDGSNVRGINTAATIWCTAGVGIFAGASLYILASIAAAGLLLGNILFRLLTEKNRAWGRFDDSGHIFVLKVVCDKNSASSVRERLVAVTSDSKLYLIQIQNSNTEDHRVELEVKYVYDGRNYIEKNESIVRKLSSLPGIQSANWTFDE